jgi:hypothetical protein
MVLNGSQSRLTGGSTDHPLFTEPGQKNRIVYTARITKMNRIDASHLKDTATIFCNFMDEEVMLLWHAMAMRMELEIHSIGCQTSYLFGIH